MAMRAVYSWIGRDAGRPSPQGIPRAGVRAGWPSHRRAGCYIASHQIRGGPAQWRLDPDTASDRAPDASPRPLARGRAGAGKASQAAA